MGAGRKNEKQAADQNVQIARKPARGKPAPETSEVLRLLAKQIFINDRKGLTIAQLADMPEMTLISQTQLSKWCDEDDWVGARARLLHDLRRDMEDVARRALVSSQRQHLVDSNEIYQMAMDQLRDEALQPKSWESMAGVAFQAQEVANRIATKLGDDVAQQASGAPQIEEGPLPPAIADMVSQELTPDEAMSAAHAVLTKRREAQLQRMIEAGPPTKVNQVPAPPPPQPVVVDAKPAPVPGPLVQSVDAKPTGGG